ncbi:hypothetical protein M0M57_06960 [Flavobacterium azooxidireducens]|uniref:Lipoprotein n=1 Tax=Flavobacterium azooxidireducens TaxID=1871076 RepID=A0ABY4KLK9_9FLAO|nr:hypothetical protein [Flavobacterium azooxidireducens]UPQ80573.1 hypothetical protein M0M57_06960 [Flavobacterium azooxidireducens]
MSKIKTIFKGYLYFYKMKKTILFLLIVNLLMISCAIKNSNERISKEQIDRTHLINEAERFILSEDYTKANDFYKQAFKFNIKPYVENCFTAAQVSAVCNQLKDFIFFTRKGFQSGLRYSDFEKDSILFNFIKDNKIELKLKQFFKSDSLIYYQSIDHELKNEVEKLSILDNKWKIFYLDSLSNYDSIVSNIVEKGLIPLIERHGYPGEKLIGMERVGSQNNNNYGFVNNKAKLILLHYYSYPRDCRYNNLLRRELQKRKY